MNEEKWKEIFKKGEELVIGLPDILKSKAFEIYVYEMIHSSIGSNNDIEGKSESSIKKSFKKISNKAEEQEVHKVKGEGLKQTVLTYIKNGFFDLHKTPEELIKEFKKKGLTSFTQKSLGVALLRLVRDEILERDGEGTSKNPWKYKKKT